MPPSSVPSTWYAARGGEALFGSVRIGARFAPTLVLPGTALVIGGFVLSIAVGGSAVAGGAPVVLVGVVLMVIGAVRAATCRTVFDVALHRCGRSRSGTFR